MLYGEFTPKSDTGADVKIEGTTNNSIESCKFQLDVVEFGHSMVDRGFFGGGYYFSPFFELYPPKMMYNGKIW